jgi:hypothetical protein
VDRTARAQLRRARSRARGWVNIGDGEASLGWVHSSLRGSAP